MGMMGLRLSKKKSDNVDRAHRTTTPVDVTQYIQDPKSSWVSSTTIIEENSAVKVCEPSPSILKGTREAEDRTVELPHVKVYESFDDTLRDDNHKSPKGDALFDAYQDYIAESMAHHQMKAGLSACLADARQEPNVICVVEREVSNKHGEIKYRTRRDCINHHQDGVGKSYVDSMRKVVEKKRVDERKKATGVTRRLMEEVSVAKENMFIYQRLINIAPSDNVSRKFHRKEFTKSRHLLDKMSRYECISKMTPYVVFHKVPWVDNF